MLGECLGRPAGLSAYAWFASGFAAPASMSQPEPANLKFEDTVIDFAGHDDLERLTNLLSNHNSI